jgi:CRP-like cAMP-binding protein
MRTINREKPIESQDGAAENPFLSALLNRQPSCYLRNRVIWREGETLGGFFIVTQGWAATYSTILPAGRLIVRTLLPGDVVGLDDLSSGKTKESLFAITDTDMVFVSSHDFANTMKRYPASAGRFLLAVHHDAAASWSSLARQSRYSARSRLAHFLVELMQRLDRSGLVKDDAFDLPMTQEMIAGAIGMTPIHLNRTIRAFVEAGLIRRDGRRFTILSRTEMLKLAPEAPERTADLRWLAANGVP